MTTHALIEAADSVETRLAEVNERLKANGGGSIYFKWFKNHTVHSKTLYAKWYPIKGGVPKEIKTTTDDPEQAYTEVLEAKTQVKSGETLLPQEIANIRYEDLRQLLVEHYQEKHPASLYTRKTEDGGTETTFAGADDMDKFFKRLPITLITATKIKEFIRQQREQGYKDPTIRRQLSRLRSAFNLAKQHDLITDNHIPSFVMPKDSEPRQGFLEQKDFDAFLAKFPEHLKPTVEFFYYTGARSGAVEKIIWEMVNKDCDAITVPAHILKQKENWEIPLVGPLEPLAKRLKELRKSFPKADAPVFDFTNFRKVWNQTCHDSGLGQYDKQTCHYHGLHPHDFRRSAARNLIKAGVDEQVAMKITGHRTREIFRRYNIQNLEDVKEALLKVNERKNRIAEMPQVAAK